MKGGGWGRGRKGTLWEVLLSFDLRPRTGVSSSEREDEEEESEVGLWTGCKHKLVSVYVCCHGLEVSRCVWFLSLCIMQLLLRTHQKAFCCLGSRALTGRGKERDSAHFSWHNKPQTFQRSQEGRVRKENKTFHHPEHDRDVRNVSYALPPSLSSSHLLPHLLFHTIFGSIFSPLLL